MRFVCELNYLIVSLFSAKHLKRLTRVNKLMLASISSPEFVDSFDQYLDGELSPDLIFLKCKWLSK